MESLDQRYVLMPSKVEYPMDRQAAIILSSVSQVKDCYLVAVLEQVYEREGKSVILFTHTCR